MDRWRRCNSVHHHEVDLMLCTYRYIMLHSLACLRWKAVPLTDHITLSYGALSPAGPTSPEQGESGAAGTGTDTGTESVYSAPFGTASGSGTNSGYGAGRTTGGTTRGGSTGSTGTTGTTVGSGSG